MRIILWILCSFSFFVGHAQELESINFDTQKYQWQEQVLIQTNHRFFITGEVLRFNLSCLLPDKTPSEISKVAYVELIDESKKSVLKQKIQLSHGIGNGNFYLPSILTSGNYVLIAYTQWMRNFSSADIAQAKLMVINPFRALPIVKSNADQKVAIQFYPESGSMAVGVPNVWVYKISKPDSLSLTSFKIVDERGKVVYSHDQIKSLIGRFSWIPKSKGPHRVILIDPDQNLRYSEINIPNSENHFHVSRMNKILIVTPHFSNNNTGFIKIGTYEKQVYSGSQIEISEKELAPGLHQMSLVINNEIVAQRPVFILPITQNLPVELSRKEIGLREQNKLILNAIGEQSRVSISVRKKDDFSIRGHALQDLYLSNCSFSISIDYFNTSEGLEMLENLLIIHKNSNFEQKQNDRFLPEMRGPIFQGRLLTTDGEPVSLRMVNLCLPSQGPQLFLARTNSYGEFNIILQDVFERMDGLFSFHGMDENIQVEIQPKYLSEYNFVNTDQLEICGSWLEKIKKQSIEVQLKNAYFKYNSDSSVTPDIAGIFYSRPSKTYRLEDYTQLPTVKDIITEYIPEVNVRQDGAKPRINTTFISNLHDKKDSALLLLNGIPISDADIILNIQPSYIEKIDIINENYIIGPLNVKGIIHIQTHQLKMDNLGPVPNVQAVEIEGVQPSKILFAPKYTTANEISSRIPDLRRELYWNPSLTIKDQPVEVSFYTSDLEGEYEILISGQTESGAVIDERLVFSVNK